MPYREIWALDFEFRAPAGHRPEVVCLCARELLSGRVIQLWADEFGACPFDTGDDVLFVAFFASAEVSCFKALGWPTPRRLLDLFAEHRAITNGFHLAAGNSLLGAMATFGLAGMAPAEKKRLRDRIIAGPPFTDAERTEILDYCMADVDATAALLTAMEPTIAATPIRFGQALLRGRYMAAVAAMEHVGTPLDTTMLDALKASWEAIKARLIDEVDEAFGVYENGSFREKRFQDLVERRGYAWPTLPSGRLALDAETFRTMAGMYPEIDPLRQLRNTLGEMRLADLAVGPDGRNRTLLSPFGTKTGRNAPSSSRFVFGPATWIRFLIRPTPGRAVAYVDYRCQEIAIAAAMSGDERLTEAVRSGDPYLAFAKTASLVPADATKATHGPVRDMMKAVVLAIGYGMSAQTLAVRLKRSVPEAQHLLRLYDEAYPRFARWRQEHLDRSLLGMTPSTVFGWTLEPDADTKPNTLKNFPVQACGGELLRLSCCMATERGLQVCAPVHDALLIEAESSKIDDAVRELQVCMGEASRIVLGDLEIGTDAKIVCYPERFTDPRGQDLFDRISRLLADEGVRGLEGIVGL